MTASETIRRWFATADAALLDEQIEWRVPGYPVPQEVYYGRDAVLNDFFPALRGNFARWGADIGEIIAAADGRNVTVRGRYVGTTHGGDAVSVPFIHIWTVEAGKIVRALAAADTAVFKALLG